MGRSGYIRRMDRARGITYVVLSSIFSSTIFIYWWEKSNVTEHWDFYIINAGTNFIIYELWQEGKARLRKFRGRKVT
jgi:hypothetical protein